MSNLVSYPMQDGFETTLSQTWDGATGTVYVNTTPDFTFPAGTTTYIVVNPGKSNMQVAKINAYDSSAKTLTVSSIAVNKGPSLAYIQQNHPVNSKIIISDNYEFWADIATAINSKADRTDLGNFTFTNDDIAISGTNFRIRRDGNSMKFRDDETAEVSLKTLTTGSGADQYVSSSATDTTVGHLDTKLTVDTGLKVSTVNPGASESRKVEIDVTDTDVFVKTSSGAGDENKIPVLGATGTIADGFISTAITGPTTVSLTAGENITIGDNLCYKNTEAVETNIGPVSDGQKIWGVASSVDYNLAKKITISATGYVQRLNSVSFFLRKNGSPTDNVFVGLYNDDLVTLVENSSIIGGATLTESEVEYTFTFSTNVLIPGKSYYLVLRRSGAEDGTNYYRAFIKTSGTANVFYFNGTDWFTALETTGFTNEFSGTDTYTTYTIDPTTVMKMDANDPLKIQDAGIATETKTAGQTVKVQMSGVVGGTSSEGYNYITDSSGISGNSDTTETISKGFKFSATYNEVLRTVTKTSYTTATSVILKSEGGATLATASFLGNTATFNYPLIASTNYRLEVYAGGSTYNVTRRISFVGFPVVGTNITYLSGSGDGSDEPQTEYAISSIKTGIMFLGAALIPGLYYYASDTAGALSTTPSTTYNIRIGKAISATQLLIDKKKISIYSRNFVQTDNIYNGGSVDYNASYANKYIRVYTGFRPTIVNTRCGTIGTTNGLASYGFSDGVINKNYRSQLTRMDIDTTASFYFLSPNIIVGLINFLNNGYELYYTKSGTSATDGNGWLDFTAE